jgi:hypothetical protein
MHPFSTTGQCSLPASASAPVPGFFRKKPGTEAEAEAEAGII